MKGLFREAKYDWDSAIATLTVEVGLVIDAKTKDRCNAIDKFTELLGEVEITSMKQDEEEMKQDIQVGDLWKDDDTKIFKTIVAIHKGIVGISFVKDDHLTCVTTRAQDVVKFYTLVERDGKKIDQYKVGAYYAVRVKFALTNLSQDVSQYLGSDRWHLTSFENQRTDNLIIGQKLDITWPEV